ncbi:hypothetical protein HHK36_016264 [Tetracentron sinense]|uniref:Glucan endo-1,3-beta-D-glucosidase n=1 Tax=Tetracentron sinense TaxID=13715 RepID=A0A835DBS7_TETSI|nr:hypothetical protein HHK36_016264 [Tetracentron sinense]
MSLSSESLALLFFFFFFFFSFTLPIMGSSALPAIGVTYVHGGSHLPRPERVATTLQSLKIACVRLPAPDPDVIRAFSYSNITLLLSIPNSFIPAMASNQSNALRWLYRHVVPFYPRARISTISVGNDILDSSADLSDFLLPAIRNVYQALHELGIHKILVSTTFSFINVMTTTFPPSAAEFQEPIADSLVKPFLDFLAETNSSILLNLYPYNVYRSNSEIPIGYALFQEQPFNFRDDLITGVRYRNLFDMMVDAVISAMAVAGYEDIPVIVTETGWPSSGDATEVDASEAYAEMYNKGLVGHLQSGLGTPLRKEGVAETYIFELFDEDMKQGSESKRHWGILYPNMTKKYGIDFSGSAQVGGVDNLVVVFWLVVAILWLQWK